jgi:hypothetical protein
MQSLTVLAIPIYQQLGKQYPNLSERREATKQYILNEITRWGIKKTDHINSYFFKPVEFKGTQNSKPFDVRLMYDDNSGLHELKFGNLNASTDDEKFEWDSNDPYKLQKALFLNDVINKEIIPLIKNKTIKGLQFSPYNGDNLADDRLSYFRNMFDKLGKDKFNWIHDGEKYYIITK